jgi:zinc protease
MITKIWFQKHKREMSVLGCLLLMGVALTLFACSTRQGLHDGNVTEVTPVAAEEAKSALPLWPHEQSDRQPDPDLYFGKLENGFRYVLMPNRNPENRVSMHLNVQAGSMQEADGQEGLAHYLEHMLFNGSEHFAPGELVKYFQSIGMQFGADANAHTGFFETVYDIFLPAGDRENLEKGLLVMRDYAGGALLLPAEIDRERKVILAEKRSRDSASYRTFVATLAFELPDARITRRLPIGTDEVLNSAGQEALKDYYDTWYRPENMILVAVGDFDVSLAAALVKQSFDGLKARAPAQPPVEFGTINHSGIKTFHHLEKEAGSTTVTIEVLAKADPRHDSESLQQNKIMEEVADRIVQNRLDASVGRPDVPGTSAAIGSGLFLNHISYAMLSMEGKPGEWEEILAFLEQTLRAALEYGFTDDELQRVKKEFIAELDAAVSKKNTRESKTLARQLIRTLNADRVFRSPEQEREMFAAFIRDITPAEVHTAFRRVWAPDHRLIMVTGNADLSGAQEGAETAIAEVFTLSQRTAVEPPVAKKIIAFPYLSPPAATGQIKTRTVIEDLDIIQVEYENGFRLNLKKTDFKDDEVVASLSFGAGRSEEPQDLPGLAELGKEAVNESALGRLDKDDLEAALAGRQTEVVFDIDESRFMFQCQTITNELELLFELLYAHLLDPGFRDDAFLLSQQRFEQQYKELAHTAEGALTLSGWRFLAGGDSRFGLPPYEEFSKLTLDQARAWIARALEEEPLELSVVGDFDVDAAIELAGRYFGSLPLRHPREGINRTDVPLFPTGKKLAIEVETAIPSALVLVAFPTDDMWDISKTRRLAVLADLFSERLRVNIREKLGESYSPFAFNRGSRVYEGYGYLAAMVETDPTKVELVIQEVKKIASDLAESGVTDDEVHRVLEPTLNRLKDMRRRNGYWLGTVLAGSTTHPRQIAWSRTIERDYADITSGDAADLAKRYLDNAKAAVIVVTPALKD